MLAWAMPIRLSLIALLVRFWLPLILVCIYAARKGGGPERTVAAMLMAAAVATVAVRSDFAVRYHSISGAVLVIDIILFGGLTIVATKANRQWPIILASLHGVTLLGHLGKALNPELWRLGYAVMISAPALPGLVVLALGTWRHRRRIAKNGADASWSE